MFIAISSLFMCLSNKKKEMKMSIIRFARLNKVVSYPFHLTFKSQLVGTK